MIGAVVVLIGTGLEKESTAVAKVGLIGVRMTVNVAGDLGCRAADRQHAGIVLQGEAARDHTAAAGYAMGMPLPGRLLGTLIVAAVMLTPGVLLVKS